MEVGSETEVVKFVNWFLASPIFEHAQVGRCLLSACRSVRHQVADIPQCTEHIPISAPPASFGKHHLYKLCRQIDKFIRIHGTEELKTL